MGRSTTQKSPWKKLMGCWLEASSVIVHPFRNRMMQQNPRNIHTFGSCVGHVCICRYRFSKALHDFHRCMYVHMYTTHMYKHIRTCAPICIHTHKHRDRHRFTRRRTSIIIYTHRHTSTIIMCIHSWWFIPLGRL